MKKCVNCTYTTENDEKFCPNCGKELIEEAPVAAMPVEEVLVAETPASAEQSVKSAASSKAVLCMIFGAASLACGLISFATEIVFGIAAVACAIIALVLCKQYLKEYAPCQFSQLAKVFGVVGLICGVLDLVVYVIAFIIALISSAIAILLSILGVIASVLIAIGPVALGFLAAG